MSRTEHGEFLFTVKDVLSGNTNVPYIYPEPYAPSTTVLGKHGFVGLELKTRDYKHAQKIADYLNEHIKAISFTIEEDHPLFNAKPPKS